jgi:hypothetical protein
MIVRRDTSKDNFLFGLIMIEIIIPLHNPSDNLIRMVDSILQQDTRNFSILLSDNHSTSGKLLIEKSVDKLSKAGLAVRLVRPPMELKKIEHWNWAHFQSRATWLKPLYSGDWLEPDYMATVLREMAANPLCSYLYCNAIRYTAPATPGKPSRATPPNLPGEATEIRTAFTGRYFSGAEMRKQLFRLNQPFGPPSVATYKREAFLALGGYRTTLPVFADSLLFQTMALRFGGLGIARPLSNILHDAPSSASRSGKQAGVFWEKTIALVALIYYAFTENVPLSRWCIAKIMTLEFRRWLFEKLHFSTP